jgi:hypothetical protein
MNSSQGKKFNPKLPKNQYNSIGRFFLTGVVFFAIDFVGEKLLNGK